MALIQLHGSDAFTPLTQVAISTIVALVASRVHVPLSCRVGVHTGKGPASPSFFSSSLLLSSLELSDAKVYEP